MSAVAGFVAGVAAVWLAGVAVRAAALMREAQVRWSPWIVSLAVRLSLGWPVVTVRIWWSR